MIEALRNDDLIEKITTTIDPESWEGNGGPGIIVPEKISMSLVVSQTPSVHRQIADLLKHSAATKKEWPRMTQIFANKAG